jgi:hypothetical protein
MVDSQIVDRRNKYNLKKIQSACRYARFVYNCKIPERLVLLAVHFVPLSHLAEVATVEQVQIIIQFYELDNSP